MLMNLVISVSIIIELANYFEVDVRELQQGERKSNNVKKDMKETLTMVADYSREEKRKLKKTFILIGLTFLAFVIGIILSIYGLCLIPPMDLELLMTSIQKQSKQK